MRHGLGLGLDARRGGVWRPSDVGGAVLWLDASLGVTTVSGGVSAWADRAGLQTVTQGTGANRPTVVAAALNGRPALAFTSPQFLTHGLRLVPPCTLIAVAKTSHVAGDYAGIGAFSSGLGGPLLFAQSAVAQRWGVYANANADSGQALTTFKRVVAVIRAFNEIDLRTNGTSVTVATGVSGYVVANAIGAANGGGTQNLEGQIAELLAFNRALSAAECQEIEGYLGGKYAL